jgi:hypothetical protein
MVDGNKFVQSITSALKNGVGITQEVANKMQTSLNNALSVKGATGLQGLDAAFKRLTNSANQFQEALSSGDISGGLLDAKVAADDVTAAWLRIQEQAKATHRSANEAASRLVKNNEIEIAAAQQALADNGKKILSNKQIENSLVALTQRSKELYAAMHDGLNLSPLIDNDIRKLATLKDQIIQNTEFYNKLASAPAGSWKTNTAAITPPDPTMGAYLNQKSNALGVRPQDIAIERGVAGINSVQELQAGLLAAGKGSDAFLLSAKEVNMIMAEQSKLAEKLALDISKVKVAEEQAAQAALNEAQAEKARNAAQSQATQMAARIAAENAAKQKAIDTANAYANKIKEEDTIMRNAVKTQQQANTVYSQFNAILRSFTNSPAKQVMTDPKAVEIYNSRLKENKQILEELKNSTDGWATASRKAITDNSIAVANAGKAIREIASQLGTNLTQAAQVAISTGQVKLGEAQGYLSSVSEKLVMSEAQVTTAVNVQQKAISGDTVAIMSNAEAQALLAKENKALAMAQNGTTEATRNHKAGLSGLVDGVTKVMGQMLLLQYVLMPVTNAIQEATKAYLELSKAQFALQSGVKATQSQIGATAGTYDQWEATIKRLAKEFPQFSEVSITRGVANITKLQASLGFTQKKMEDLIDAGVALAQMSGEDLGAALQDVVQALGGSSVVLDKYGIFVRDADKNTSNFAKSIGKSTDQMTSQELALATLEAIVSKTNPLLASMGDYTSTMGGKIAIANANIEESYAALGEVTSQFDLYFKNLYADLLNGVTQALPLFTELLNTIKNINGETDRQKKTSETMEKDKLSPFNKYQIQANRSDKEMDTIFTSLVQDKNFQNLAYEKLDNVFLDRSREFIAAMFPNIHGAEFEAKLKEFRADYVSAWNKIQESLKPKPQTGGKSPDERGEDNTVTPPIDQKVLDTLKKYYQDAIDITTQYNDDIAALDTKRKNDRRDAEQEAARQVRDANASLVRDIAKNERDAEFDRTKALFKLNNDIANLEDDANKQKEQKTKEAQDKSREAWEDYYKELRLLDQEYLFDLRDAVADNDAVSIKRLERKYNLDKNKINERLQDRLNTEQKNLNKSNDQIDQDTKDKKEKLIKAYNEELQLIQMNLDNRNEEQRIKNQEQLDDIQTNLNDKYDAIEQNYKDERDLQDTHYEQKLRDLGIKLGQEEAAVLAHLDLLLGDYKKYFGDDGELLTIMRGFYDEQSALSTSAIAGQSGFKSVIADPAFQKYFKDTYGIDINNLTPMPESNPSRLPYQPFAPVEFNNTGENAPIKVEFSSDGTIPEQFYDIISNRTIEIIGDSIGKVIAK